MKLSEVFAEIFVAEDKASEQLRAARDEAQKIGFDARNRIEKMRKSKIEAAQEEASAVISDAREHAEDEVSAISKNAESARLKMSELFQQHADALMTKLAGDVLLVP